MRLITRQLLLTIIILSSLHTITPCQEAGSDFIDPPREFSLMPFWFWNDTLKDKEIVRQIVDFESHGVYGFVIHPRIGLPENTGWLSDEMIHFMNVAIEEASRRKMYVILYDEGMYPSGSSSGQVVMRNPGHAARGLLKIDLKPGEEPSLTKDSKLITIIDRPGSKRVAVIEKPSGGVIRGIHYKGEGTDTISEEHPPAGDILNPDAVSSFIELVYDRYLKEFGKYFGNTIVGIFTDEPSPLGRGSEPGMVPGNGSLLPHISQSLGYDFTPYLASLWDTDNPDWKKHRTDYYLAINKCLEEIYYKRLGNWCSYHGISLMGHPAGSMDIGTERYFQVPGQDLVWRYVEPGPKALEGEHSTMAKCASSSMIHIGLRRNSNELYGAYGHNLTYDEMVWLAGWCFVRGHNLLLPHAFYYSVRGPRFDERPPDVGPNSGWWANYKSFADACRRLSWVNTDSRHACEVAILAGSTFLPDEAARICFQNQRDFNYLELRHLLEDTSIDSKGVHIKGMNYRAIILDSLSYIPSEILPVLRKLAKNGRLIVWKNSAFSGLTKGLKVVKTDGDLIMEIDRLIKPGLTLIPHSDNIRYRHVIKDNDHYFLLFNEESDPVTASIKFPVAGMKQWLDPFTANTIHDSTEDNIIFRPFELKLVKISGAEK